MTIKISMLPDVWEGFCNAQKYTASERGRRKQIKLRWVYVSLMTIIFSDTAN